MKNSLLYLIITALLFFTVTPAFAGFWVKKTAPVTQSGIAATTSETQRAKHTFLRKYRLKERLFPNRYRYRDRSYKQGEWIAIVAFSCGILGLFIPGLNFAAILFGLLGIGKGSKLKGLAVTGFILGVLELLLFLVIGTVFISLITL